jgi:hypothetical protein
MLDLTLDDRPRFKKQPCLRILEHHICGAFEMRTRGRWRDPGRFGLVGLCSGRVRLSSLLPEPSASEDAANAPVEDHASKIMEACL